MKKGKKTVKKGKKVTNSEMREKASAGKGEREKVAEQLRALGYL